MVRMRGLEPPRSCEHMHLKHACIPISAHPRILHSILTYYCAQEETRTPTLLRALTPEASVYTNFTTWAQV